MNIWLLAVSDFIVSIMAGDDSETPALEMFYQLGSVQIVWGLAPLTALLGETLSVNDSLSQQTL